MTADDAKTDLDVRQSFLALAPGDMDLLRDLAPLLEAHADTLVSAFYRHLLSFESTQRLLADPEVKERLLHKQRDYLLSLAGPTLDEHYVQERLRIGVTHERIGLEPRWYLGAYSLYFGLLVPMIRDQLGHDLDRFERTVAALQKVLMLDAQLAMEAYIARHQQELEHLNRELAETSRGLARDLDDRDHELRQTSRRARAAEDLASVATLVAGLAHEIGTPMGVIQGHAEALEPAVTDEKGRWRLQTIREQIDRISRIIQALLNMARPRESVSEPVELEPLLETTLSFLGVKLRRRRVEVASKLEPCPSIRGDAEKLQQLFLNLMLNAADAMKETGGTLQVTLRREDDQVEVMIADTGPGIPEDQIDRIFDPFFTTKAAGEGNGLGLVVCQGIARDHGGRLEVESTVGEGTAFRLHLPAAKATPKAAGA